jgi:tRNA(Arg) A34 adenosine deaminase TadA
MLLAQLQLALPDWVTQQIDTARLYADDESRVALAIELARRNLEMSTGGPFGAAVFSGSGQLISLGVNRVIPLTCSVAHAEMMAFMLAQTRLQRARLNEPAPGEPREKYILATSAQPCCQCYGATVWAGIDELLIGARSEDVEELTEFDEGPLPADWVGELERRGIRVKQDILREAARTVLGAYTRAGGDMY